MDEVLESYGPAVRSLKQALGGQMVKVATDCVSRDPEVAGKLVHAHGPSGAQESQ
jgi:hypothetical protein